LSTKHETPHRNLQSIDAAWLLPETNTTLETGNGGEGVRRPWDQFEANRRLFDVPDTFDENLYTKALDRGTITKEQREYAEKVASLIEKTMTSNPHLKEERGQVSEKEEEDNWNEEDRYSGVWRDEIVEVPSVLEEEGEEEKHIELKEEESRLQTQELVIPTVAPVLVKPVRSTKLKLQIDIQSNDELLPHEHKQENPLPISRSNSQTPTLLRATAVEFIPTPTLKTTNSEGISLALDSPRDSSSSKATTGRKKDKNRKSKNSPLEPLPSPPEKSNLGQLPVTPSSSDINNSYPPQTHGPGRGHPVHYQQLPPHYPPIPMPPSQGGYVPHQQPHQQQHPQQIYLQSHPQMNGQMFPFGMPPPMFAGPPMVFPMGGPLPYPLQQMPYPPGPYGYPPQMTGPMHFPPTYGQYTVPMPGQGQFYAPPQSYALHFVPHHYPPPNQYPPEPIPVAAALGDVYHQHSK
jgi:hypothetical protein